MRIWATAVAIALVGLLGCQDDRPAGPTTQDFEAAREELARSIEKEKRKPPQVAKVKPAEAGEQHAFAAEEPGFHYDPKKGRDPFRSFEWEQLRLEMNAAAVRTPLEQFDLSQLELLAVVWNAKNARALIADPSGMSYIVAEGARIGKNEGRVTRIHDNLVVVRETYVDFSGERTTKELEMRIHGAEGGA